MERESSVPCLSGLFCIISGESALLIQCMKITFIETFIKAVRANLIHPGRTWRRGKPICQSLPSASTPFLLSPSVSEGPMLGSLGSGLMACGKKTPGVLHLLTSGQLCARPQLCGAQPHALISMGHTFSLDERTAGVSTGLLPPLYPPRLWSHSPSGPGLDS